jgi:transcriptional regulator with XRE-family HTH domain
LEEDIREAARRRADVESDKTGGIDREGVERGGELGPASTDVRRRFRDRDRRVRRDEIARLAVEARRVTLPHPDLAAKDEGLRPTPRLDEATFHEQLVESDTRRLASSGRACRRCGTHTRIVAQPAALGLITRPSNRPVRAVWFDGPMPISRTDVARETTPRMRRLGLHTGEEIRRLRLDAGVSLADLAAVTGIHKSHIARIEASQVQPSLTVLSAIGVALGADLSVRFFAGSGPRLHDRFQAAMVEGVLRIIDERWIVQLEVPVSHPARGVIDIVLADRASPIAIAAEVQSEIRRLEQQVRWSSEKADGRLERISPSRPGVNVSRLLILRSTSATRDLARRYAATLAAAYPAKTEAVVHALTEASTPWPGPGIVWMRIDAGVASLLSHPPRGVALGR